MTYSLKLLICFAVMPLMMASLSGCSEKKHWPPCDPLPVKDGFFETIKTKNGVSLKFPDYVDVRRGSREFNECQYVDHFFIDYLWYEGKLIPAGINSTKVPPDKYFPVTIYSSGINANIANIAKNDFFNSWTYEQALPHKKFPLEFYPHYFWDDPKQPSQKALKRARSDQKWGIRNTKYKDPVTKSQFEAFCNIAPIDPSKPDSRVEADFEKFGDSKCRGTVVAEKNGKVIYVMIDVWAYRGKDKNQTAIREINQIYDATVEQLQSFIQE